MHGSNTVTKYIQGFPPQVQKKLVEIRAIIIGEIPEAEESIRYGMPAYRLSKPLVYFGAFRDHIGFFPTPSGISHFEKDLLAYAHTKGTIKFSLHRPLPTNLIKRIVRFRVKEVRYSMKQ